MLISNSKLAYVPENLHKFHLVKMALLREREKTPDTLHLCISHIYDIIQ